MTISNIKAAGQNSVDNGAKQNQSLYSIGKKGQVVTGVITKISDKTGIRFGDKEIEMENDAIRDALIGQIRQFEIMDVSDKGISLKEIKKDTTIEDNRGIFCTTVATDKTILKEQQKQEGQQTGSVDESAGESEEKLGSTGNRMNEKDLDELDKEGMSIEKFEMERLERALTRIKSQRKEKEKSLDSQVENQKNYKEEIKKAATSGLVRNPAEEKMAQKLLEEGLPVTEDNLEKIASAMEHSGAAPSMTDRSMKYYIVNQMDSTINNIYHAAYAGSSRRYGDYQAGGQSWSGSSAAYSISAEAAGETAASDAWAELAPQAEKIIKDAGLDVIGDTMRQAEWLYSNDLPITEQNLKALDQLERIKNNYNADEVLEQIVRTLQKGLNPEQAYLEPGDGRSAQTVENFLEQLKQMEAAGSNGTDISQITAKRQIEEIRLKMTTEAGQQLISKGIRLDTEDLQRVVEGLREIENEYYRNILNETGCGDGEDNIRLLKETTEKINALKEAPSYMLGATFRTRSVQTVDTLHEAAFSIKVRLEKAGATYDALGTAPRKDMGDSIQKAFRNVDDILKDLGMEETEPNRRAVKILGYNRMEITPDSVTSMKAYDGQVQDLLTGLHPAVAAEMIKKGINPLDTPISELNENIDQLKRDMGITDEEKYSRFLWKLDRTNEFSEDERKAFVGVYRLLASVEKTDGAAVGSVVNAGREVTLNNLLTAVRTRKSKGINEAVSDASGVIDSVSRKSESITDQVDYFNRVLRDIQSDFNVDTWNLASDNLMDFEERMERLMDRPVEILKEELNDAAKDQESDMAYREQRLSQIRELAKNSQEEIHFLTDYNQPVTIQNLIAARQMASGGKAFFKGILDRSGDSDQEQTTIKSLEEISDSLSDPQAMSSAYDRLGENIKSILDKNYDNPLITSKDLAALKQMGGGVELAKALCREEYYEIPVLTGGRITNINLTIVKGEKENGKVQIGMDSELLGRMEAELTIRDNTVKGYVLCDNMESLQAFKEEKENLKDAMEGLGLNVGQLDYGMDRGQKQYFNRSVFKGDNTDTKTLYQVAKVFVQKIKNLEGRTLERFGE